jgi:hypothetical protein
MYHFDELVKKEFKLDQKGQAFISLSGAARICNITPGALSKILQEKQDSKTCDLKTSKLAQILIQQGFLPVTFSEKGIPDTALALIIEYYAFDAQRTTQEALLAYRAFAAIGIRVWIQQELGEEKLIKKENNLESKLDQILNIVSSQKEKLDHQQEKLTQLESEIKEAKIVKEKITINFKGVGEMLNKSLNTSDKDYKLIQEVFQEYDYLKLIDIIKIFRPNYTKNSVVFKKLLNKVRRSAGTTYRDVSLGETVSTVKSNIVFTKNQVSSVLITIDRCYKEIITDLRFNDDGQMSLF